MNLLNVLLMSPQQGGSGGGWSQIVMLLAIVVIFYFFMIRPQTQKAKKEKQFRESLQKGQKVITIGGIHGKIIEVKSVIGYSTSDYVVGQKVEIFYNPNKEDEIYIEK